MNTVNNNDENMKVLKEIHKGAKMGMDAISYVSDKVGDSHFRDELSSQYNQYDDILNRVNDSYTNYGEVPKDNNYKDKFMSWMGVQMNTMNDQSNSKLSELLIQGTVMGIIEGRKILNKKKINKEVESIVSDYVTMQEKNVETLKSYL